MYTVSTLPPHNDMLQVLCHVTTRLQSLHDAGLVHRDLKPGNVLWRPQHLEWTLIDFGCAAPTGARPPYLRYLLCGLPMSYILIGPAQQNAKCLNAVRRALHMQLAACTFATDRCLRPMVTLVQAAWLV